MRFAKTAALFLLLTGLTFTSCEKDTEPKPVDKEEIEAGSVKGRLLTAQGQPIAGAKVYAGHLTYHNTNVVGVTDADGYYKLDIDQPGGTWSVHAQVTRPYNGTNYTFYVYANNADPISGTAGAIRNLTWKLSGAIPGTDNGKYGAKVAYYDNSSIYIRGEEIEFTLVPQGPLADGSTGQSITAFATARFAMTGTTIGSGLDDVPMGRYRITARYVPANGGAPRVLSVRLRDTGSYTNNVVIDFEQWTESLRLVEVETKLL